MSKKTKRFYWLFCSKNNLPLRNGLLINFPVELPGIVSNRFHISG